jgi:hypothetical protein
MKKISLETLYWGFKTLIFVKIPLYFQMKYFEIAVIRGNHIYLFNFVTKQDSHEDSPTEISTHIWK